jgi:hypothetical protein
MGWLEIKVRLQDEEIEARFKKIEKCLDILFEERGENEKEEELD